MNDTISLRFDPAPEIENADRLRDEVRAFLANEQSKGRLTPTHNSWTVYDPEFSERCGERGYIGMTWPEAAGGQARSPLERYIVIEELLAGGAPVGAHWIADRQSGPQIIGHGSREAQLRILPGIVAGTCYFAIGMSEPNSGSDLASVRTRAERADGGYKVTGNKLWTSGAHIAHYIIALVRTAPAEDGNRHAGLTQLIIDLKSPGIEMRPVIDLSGRHHFNEIFFDEVFVPDDMRLGTEGEGWKLVTGELANERSGPERFLSNLLLMKMIAEQLKPEIDRGEAVELGRLTAHLMALRRMSGSVAGMLEAGRVPNAEAALVKDVGTRFEQEVPEAVRRLMPEMAEMLETEGLADTYRDVMMTAPSYTLRGGTNEVLRGIIARELGLR